MLLCLASYAMPQLRILRNISEPDGLSGTIVFSIYKDASGYLWIGTEKGLNIFDGTHVVQISSPGCSAGEKLVQAITETDDGRIIAGNRKGLWVVDSKYGKLDRMNAEIRASVTSLACDKDKLYVGTDDGLYVVKGGKSKRVIVGRTSLEGTNNINSIDIDDAKTLWLATAAGLVSLNGARQKIYRSPDYTNFTTIKCYGNSVFIGTQSSGVVRFDIKTKKFERYLGLSSSSIKALSIDKVKKQLYAGSDGAGVSVIDLHSGRVINRMEHNSTFDNTIKSNSVYSLLYDRDGILWIGTFQMGLDYTLYQNGFFKLYSFLPLFNSYNLPVRTISVTGSQRLIGTRDGLYYIDEKRNIVKLYKTPEIRSNLILSSLFYNGIFYFGTFGGGAYTLNPSTTEITPFGPSDARLTDISVFSFQRDQYNHLWMATSAGLYCFGNGKQLYHFDKSSSSLPSNDVYDIYFDTSGKAWVGTEGGLCIFDPYTKSIRTDVIKNEAMKRLKVRNTFETSKGHILLSPYEGPLWITDVEMSFFRQYKGGNMLSNLNCMFTIEDRNHNLWLGTDNGFFKFTESGTVIPYTFRDGLPSNNFLSCVPVKGSDNRGWFGCSKGVFVGTNVKKRIALKYKIRVTGVSVDGQRIPTELSVTGRQSSFSANAIRLDHTDGVITLHVSDFSYTLPEGMLFEYKLEGHDEGWRVLQGKTDINYYDMGSGTYTLRLRYPGRPETETSTTIVISPSILTILIYSLIFLSVCSCCIFIYIIRYRRSHTSRPVESGEHDDDLSTEKYKTIKISDEECKALQKHLETLMQDKKPFTDQELTLQHLASQLGVRTYILSYLFNSYLKCGYTDYVNNYRVEEFKNIVGNKDFSKYTLDTIAKICGFSSKSAFFRNFKRIEGITPSEYVKQLKKHE